MCDVDYCALCDFLRSRHGRRKSFFCRSPFGVVWRWSGLIFCLWGSDGQFEYFIIYWRLFRSAFFFWLFCLCCLLRNWKSCPGERSVLWPSLAKCGKYYESFFSSLLSIDLFEHLYVCARIVSSTLMHASSPADYFIHISSRYRKVWHLLVRSIPLKAIFAMVFLPLISFEAIFTICARTRHSMWEPQNLSMGNGHDKRNENDERERERDQKNRFIKTNEKLAGKIIWAMITH